jgi:hypothetical protein
MRIPIAIVLGGALASFACTPSFADPFQTGFDAVSPYDAAPARPYSLQRCGPSPINPILVVCNLTKAGPGWDPVRYGDTAGPSSNGHACSK